MKTNTINHSLYMEQTPNPDTVKFISNHYFIEQDMALDFKSINEADLSPLAQALFKFPFVKHVLISANYIAVTKQKSVSWDDILFEVRDYISGYLNKGNLVLKENIEDNLKNNERCVEDVAVKHSQPSTDVEQKIIDILNEYIIPAVARDGGFITFLSYNNGIVTLQMRGACSGCPSASYTLKAGIEALLKKLLPNDVTEVIAEPETL